MSKRIEKFDEDGHFTPEFLVKRGKSRKPKIENVSSQPIRIVRHPRTSSFRDFTERLFERSLL